jgi:tetraacyldisaccharide 4'-kinase
MRTAIENWLLRHWYGTHRPPLFLRALEPVYHWAFQRSQSKKQTSTDYFRPSSALIVVGNITAGGTGKTPLVIHLCELAKQLNLKAGIASTGYGRQGRDTTLVKASSDTHLCGDEPVLLAQRTGVPVVVAANRLDAVRMLDEMQLDLIISDDGLQQANLGRDIEVCVVDGSRGLGNGHLIPAGPLREVSKRLEQVDYVISNGQWKEQPERPVVYTMHLHASSVCSLDGARSLSVEQFLQDHAGSQIHAFAGIGNPGRFFNMLRDFGLSVTCHGFSDHHSFSPADFDICEPTAIIIMTEKDAVKCRKLELENAWYIPVKSQLPVELEQKLKQHIMDITKESL